MSKKALITGITGQDGSYLAELLLEKGYSVFGLVRHSSNPYYSRIAGILNQVELLEGDLTDTSSLASVIKYCQPDEVYNLAAQSFVGLSWKQPITTCDITGMGVLNILETLRRVKPDAKFYQASSSEMFGKVKETPQSEDTPFYPRSPYGIAKVFGHWLSVNYRESYNMHTCSGILFNHESPRRGLEFVTRKITNHVARIKKGKINELRLGNLEAKRDWGHAKDYVEGMWLMLQQDKPEDFVLATGETHSVREFCDIAFKKVGLNYQDYVVVDPKFYRPSEVDILTGDSSKAQKILGWKPKYSFEDLVSEMVEFDLKLLD